MDAKAFSALGRASLTFIPEKTGRYIVFVNAIRFTSIKARYQLTASVDTATVEDQERVRAEGLLAESTLLIIRGDAESLRGAMQKLEESLEFWARTKESHWESITRGILGLQYAEAGEFGKAWEHLNRGLLLCRTAGDLHCEAAMLNNLGLVYLSLGDTEKAVAYLERVRTLMTNLGDANGIVWSTSHLGLALIDTGKPQRALELFKETLPIIEELGNPDDKASIFGNMGKAYAALGDWPKLLEYSQQALPLYHAAGEYGNEAAMLNNIGSAYDELGDTQKALGYYHQALPLYNATINKRYEASTFHNLMQACKSLRRSRLAIFYGKQAVNLYQEQRGSASPLGKESLQSYLRSVENTYRMLSELLIEEGRLGEAVQLLNSFKDQQFFDFDPAARKEPAPLALTAREIFFAGEYGRKSERAGVLGAQLDDLRAHRGEPQSDAEETALIKKLEGEFQAASNEFLSLLKLAEAEFKRPPSKQDQVAEVSEVREMQAALKELKHSTGHSAVAIYTLVGEESYRALIVTPDGVAMASKTVKGAELNERAQQMWALLQGDTYDPRIIARKLYDSVFKPVEAKLPAGTDTLLWSLDGSLRYVPIAALYDGRKYLVERYQNVVFTRADRERMTRPVSPKWTGVGLGSSEAHEVSLLGETINFPPLPGVEDELAAIFRTRETPSGLLDGEVLRNRSFTQVAMLAALGWRRPLVHIASHFSFRPGDEARSFLLLGDGTALTLSEMKKQSGLFAGAELLTLSACNTAAQRAEANGREIDGFAELAQRLGAAAVLATLWSVADNSTPWLMRDFYRRREGDARTPKGVALRQAQLALLAGEAKAKPMPADTVVAESHRRVRVKRSGDTQQREGVRAEVIYVVEADAPLYRRDDRKPFAHPYYWAPFILIGNWR
jgi:CHAT domain-containing protein